MANIANQDNLDALRITGSGHFRDQGQTTNIGVNTALAATDVTDITTTNALTLDAGSSFTTATIHTDIAANFTANNCQIDFNTVTSTGQNTRAGQLNGAATFTAQNSILSYSGEHPSETGIEWPGFQGNYTVDLRNSLLTCNTTRDTNADAEAANNVWTFHLGGSGPNTNITGLQFGDRVAANIRFGAVNLVGVSFGDGTVADGTAGGGVNGRSAFRVETDATGLNRWWGFFNCDWSRRNNNDRAYFTSNFAPGATITRSSQRQYIPRTTSLELDDVTGIIVGSRFESPAPAGQSPIEHVVQTVDPVTNTITFTNLTHASLTITIGQQFEFERRYPLFVADAVLTGVDAMNNPITGAALDNGFILGSGRTTNYSYTAISGIGFAPNFRNSVDFTDQIDDVVMDFGTQPFWFNPTGGNFRTLPVSQNGGQVSFFDGGSARPGFILQHDFQPIISGAERLNAVRPANAATNPTVFGPFNWWSYEGRSYNIISRASNTITPDRAVQWGDFGTVNAASLQQTDVDLEGVLLNNRTLVQANNAAALAAFIAGGGIPGNFVDSGLDVVGIADLLDTYPVLKGLAYQNRLTTFAFAGTTVAGVLNGQTSNVTLSETANSAISGNAVTLRLSGNTLNLNNGDLFVDSLAGSGTGQTVTNGVLNGIDLDLANLRLGNGINVTDGTSTGITLDDITGTIFNGHTATLTADLDVSEIVFEGNIEFTSTTPVTVTIIQGQNVTVSGMVTLVTRQAVVNFTSETAMNGGVLAVMRYDGTTWSTIGTATATAGGTATVQTTESGDHLVIWRPFERRTATRFLRRNVTVSEAATVPVTSEPIPTTLIYAATTTAHPTADIAWTTTGSDGSIELLGTVTGSESETSAPNAAQTQLLLLSAYEDADYVTVLTTRIENLDSSSSADNNIIVRDIIFPLTPADTGIDGEFVELTTGGTDNAQQFLTSVMPEDINGNDMSGSLAAEIVFTVSGTGFSYPAVSLLRNPDGITVSQVTAAFTDVITPINRGVGYTVQTLDANPIIQAPTGTEYDESGNTNYPL